MRDEARVIQLAEWAERTNAETRAYMRHGNLRDWAQEQLTGLMTDEEAAARVAADLSRVWALLSLEEEDEDCWERDRKSWAGAAAEYHKDRGDRILLVWAEPREAVGAARSTLRTAEFLLQQKDPAQMRRWLSRHSAAEREAILRHLEQKKRGG
jgi:hypothetical protein